jgi:plasmid replication initiation protein
MPKDLVVMDNNLIRASYKLTANEMRLILCALAQIPKDEPIDPKKAYYITKEDFVRLGVAPNNVAREIREACSDLLDRVVTIEMDVGTLKFHWLHSVLHFKSENFERLKKQYPDSKNDEAFIHQLRKYNLLDSLPIISKSDDNIVARIVFHENMMPYISQLKEQFTKLKLKDVFGFSSFYSFRFYLMMMQFKETGFCKISIDELRNALDLNEKYPLSADLKRWVIDVACNEINEKSPYAVKYELIKKGNKFHSLEMKFKKKAIEKPTSQRDPDTVDMFAKMTDAQRHLFANKLSEFPEMSKYSQGTESYQQFAVRIAEMLQDPEKRKELAPYLVKAGFNEKPC